MLTAEVVEHEVERQGVAVVLVLLAECVCQSGEPAKPHPDAQVHALDIGRADMLVVR